MVKTVRGWVNRETTGDGRKGSRAWGNEQLGLKRKNRKR